MAKECLLCQSSQLQFYYKDEGLTYFQCRQCRIVFLSPDCRLLPETEKARYETHENDPADDRYREFLSRLTTPLMQRVPHPSKGLDFGSGPGPTLSVMMEEKGYGMSVYDPYFSPDTSVLEVAYDFITCTETAEHFYDPLYEFNHIDRMLKPGGWLGVMTEPLVEKEAFGDWYYRKDPTHVCFYSQLTFDWIAKKFHWKYEPFSRSVHFFHKVERYE